LLWKISFYFESILYKKKKKRTINVGGHQVGSRGAPSREEKHNLNILIQSLIDSGEWFWIKEDSKTTADNDPVVGSVVLDTWNTQPYKPMCYNDGTLEVEMRFLQRPHCTHIVLSVILYGIALENKLGNLQLLTLVPKNFLIVKW
jgi:hypothetical protein